MSTSKWLHPESLIFTRSTPRGHPLESAAALPQPSCAPTSAQYFCHVLHSVVAKP
ncbi:hypothetical protein PVAP13_5KG233407 [Panicum virgatum]|uniref:Uncharacterized protein n=1 Tax=Panicum virgatum TaxID=38727 RepID=A0A8T0SMN6_PANVG|nr:hypothetical protein PVAP13_5KG233407 [Panicum virgatum]